MAQVGEEGLAACHAQQHAAEASPADCAIPQEVRKPAAEINFNLLLEENALQTVIMTI